MGKMIRLPRLKWGLNWFYLLGKIYIRRLIDFSDVVHGQQMHVSFTPSSTLRPGGLPRAWVFLTHTQFYSEAGPSRAWMISPISTLRQGLQEYGVFFSQF